jgi:pimeloyl-ACP methyl ester carboxylesterase
MASTPETRYALSSGNHIAYQVAEGAERDILYVSRTPTPIDLLWDDPIVARGLRRLTACGRLIMCDLRGWGASDSIETTRLPAMQAWMDDIGAVLDAAESDQATLIGASESALPLMLFAATNPGRTTGLVLINAFAHFLRTPETPFGMPPEFAERYVELSCAPTSPEFYPAFACPPLSSTERATNTYATAIHSSSLIAFPAPGWSRSRAATMNGSQARSSRSSTRSSSS